MTCSFSGVDSRDGFSFGALRIVSAGPALQIVGGDDVDLMAKGPLAAKKNAFVANSG
jgi:hypothetical protein